jgi:hypothetical protein
VAQTAHRPFPAYRIVDYQGGLLCKFGQKPLLTRGAEMPMLKFVAVIAPPDFYQVMAAYFMLFGAIGVFFVLYRLWPSRESKSGFHLPPEVEKNARAKFMPRFGQSDKRNSKPGDR